MSILVIGFGIAVLVAAFWGVYRFFKTSQATIDSVVDTDFVDGDEDEPETKFNERCTLLSKECRGTELWIVFIDENACMQEELQSEDSETCVDRNV